MQKRAAVVSLLLGLALVVCADLWHSAICPGDDNGHCGQLSSGSQRTDDEQGCDHCVVCSVSHGHFQSVVPIAVTFIEPPSPFALALIVHTHSSDLHPQEIFHPPLPATV